MKFECDTVRPALPRTVARRAAVVMELLVTLKVKVAEVEPEV